MFNKIMSSKSPESFTGKKWQEEKCVLEYFYAKISR